MKKSPEPDAGSPSTSPLVKPEPRATKASRMDVAKLAGVSPATVSLVLNGKSGELRISSETRTRVLAAAKELKYHPNPLMQSILRGRTQTISLWTAREAWYSRNPYWTSVLQGVREAASDFGHDILLHTDRCDEDVRRALSRMLGGLVDGVVIVPVKHDLMAEGLAASHLPTIAMGNPYPGLPCVHADSAYGMRLVVEHVLQKGHRSIAYFGRQGVPLAADEERVGVVRKVLAEAGIPLGEDRIIPLTDPGQIPLEAFWAMRPRPTAVVCFNDYRAGLLLEECRKQGIRVPEDLAIAGFDGAPEAPGGRQITTFTVDNEGIYRKTIELLIELIEGKAVPADTVVKGRFTEGNTT